MLLNCVNRVNHRSKNLGDVGPAHPEVPSEVSPGLDGHPVDHGRQPLSGLFH